MASDGPVIPPRRGPGPRDGLWAVHAAAESADGIHFEGDRDHQAELLAGFPEGGYFYGMSRLGQLSRSRDPRRVSKWARIRFAMARCQSSPPRGARRCAEPAAVFFTAIGDTPERVLMSTVDLTPDWTTWRATAPAEVLQPRNSLRVCGHERGAF